MSTTDDPIELLKAERAAADLAYYFGTTDLHDKYEATQAATYTAIESLVSELAQMKRQVYDLRSERDALRAQLDGMTVEEEVGWSVMRRLVGPWVEAE